MAFTYSDLRIKQSLPLEIKEQMSIRRIEDWYWRWGGNVHVSYSGGLDSTVLINLVRRRFPDVKGVFIDTGLEFPEIRKFVKSIDNVIWIKPKMKFWEVLDRYGYPVISKDQSCAISRYRNTKDPQQKQYRLYGFPNGKRGMIRKKWQFLIDAPFKISDKCCEVMKEKPLDDFEKKTGSHPMAGVRADESNRRTNRWMRYGCNAFNQNRPVSWPIAFWTHADVLEYLRVHDVPYSKIYDMGYKRTGCMFCMFGVDQEPSDLFAKNRFELMKRTHPKQYEYCINRLGCGEVLDYIGVNY